jgi:DNA-binding SARP family transcriptional activator
VVDRLSSNVYRILGPLELEVNGQPIDAGPPKQRAVLALLLISVSHVVPVDTIIDQLWGDEPPPRALGSLQAYVSNLRRLLEPDRAPRDPARTLITRSPGYVLCADDGCVDAVLFEQLLASGSANLEVGRLAEGLADLDEGLGLWRGVPLADFAFEPFSGPERSRLEELRAGAEEDRAQIQLELGNHQSAVAELERLASDAPFRERRWELLMLALYRCGRQAEALQAFQTARRSLAEELGLEPGPRLQRIEGAILRQDAALEWRPRRAVPLAELPDTGGPAPERDGEQARTPLVGRHGELAELGLLLNQRGETVEVVSLSGEAGIGKTTLVEELARRARRQALAVAWGRCVEIEGAPPLWPWVSVMESLGVEMPGSLRTARSAQGGRPTERASFEYFADLARLLVQAGRRKPTLIVLEDLHWADSSTLGVLRILCGDIRESKLRLVVTFRETDVSPEVSEALSALARVPGHRRVALGGLRTADVADLVSSVVGAAIEESVAERLRDRTDGNPFFLTELIKLLSSEGRLTAGDVEGRVPSVVSDVIRSRVLRLPADTQSLLSVASVCGQEFDFDVVCAVTGVDEDAALDLIEGAIATGIVKEPPLEIGRCQFCHALVRETLYLDVSGLRRARLHRRVAEAMEALYADGTEDHTDELAFHFWSALPAGTAEQAYAHSCRAAERAGAASAHAEAATQWEHALFLLDKVKTSAGVTRYDLLLRLGLAERLAARAASSRQHLQQAAEVAEAEGDPVRAAEAAVAGGSGSVWNWTGTYYGDPSYVALLDRVAARLSDEPRLRALVLASLAGEHANIVGDRTAAAAADALSIARNLEDRDVMFAALNASYIAAQGSPDLGRRRDVAEELVEVARSVGFDRGVVGLLWRFIARLQGGDSSADEDLEAASVFAAASRQPALLTYVEFNRALMALHRGPLVEAEAAIQRAVESFGFGHEWDGYTAQVFLLHWLRGELPKLAELAGHFAVHPAPGLREAGAMALASVGRVEEARLAVCGGTPPRLPPLLRDYTYCVALCVRAEAIALIGDSELAASCLDELAPFSGQLAVVNAAVSMGAVDFYLGRLLSALGRPEAAIASFDRAAALNRGAGGRPFAALSAFWGAEEKHGFGGDSWATERARAVTDAQSLGMRLGPR